MVQKCPSPTGLRPNVQVRQFAGVGSVAHPAESFATIVAEPETLHEPLPVSANLEQSPNASQGSEHTAFFVLGRPGAVIVTPLWCSSCEQGHHAPSEHPVQDIVRVKAFAAAVAARVLPDHEKKMPLAPSGRSICRNAVPSCDGCTAVCSHSLGGAIADAVRVQTNSHCRSGVHSDTAAPLAEQLADPNVSTPKLVTADVRCQTVCCDHLVQVLVREADAHSPLGPPRPGTLHKVGSRRAPKQTHTFDQSAQIAQGILRRQPSVAESG